jgi:hypothetical protein
MPINPITGLEEDELSQILTQADAKRKAFDEQNSGYDTTGAIAGALASLGAGFQGRDSVGAANTVLNQRRQDRKDELSALDKWKESKIAEIKARRDNEAYNREKSQLAMDDDPTSESSKSLQMLASKMLPSKDFSKMSGAQINKLLPSVTKLYEIDQQKLNRADSREQRNFEKATKEDEKRQGRMTTFGEARTENDAKELKEAAIAKQKFDSSLGEMIKLREKHDGGATFNREDVARGKQLSRDLLLAKKNMENLGVLSKTDEDIVNAIIPKDPLAYDMVPGQDPILSNMKKFRDDSEKSFQEALSQRLRVAPKNKVTKTVKVISPGGGVKEIPEDKLDAALAAGGKLMQSTAGM